MGKKGRQAPGGVYSERSRREHSLIELDVLLELLPILESRRHYGLSVDEGKIPAGEVPVERQAGERQLRPPTFVGNWV
jgi:hypothetical protein